MIKKIIKGFLAFVLTFVIVIVGIGVYFVKTFDLNKYKTQVSELVEKQLGRKLVIAGDAYLGLSMVPTIIVEKVQLVNAEWSSNPLMVGVEKVEVQFAILPLLKKQIEINKVLLDEPEIYLEINKAGDANWVFAKKDKAQAAASGALETGEQKAAEAHPAVALLAGFSADDVLIKNGLVQYDDALKGTHNRLLIKEITTNVEDMDAPVLASFDVNLDGSDIIGKLTAGSLNSLLKEQPYDVDLSAKAFNVDLAVKGKLMDLFKDIYFDLAVNVYNPKNNFGAPETRLLAEIKGSTAVVDADISMLEVAKNKISGRVKADISGNKPYVEADLKSDLIDLQSFSSKPSASAMLSMVSEAKALEMVPNDKVPFDLLYMANAKVNLNIKNLLIEPGMSAADVLLKAVIANGILNVNQLNLNFGGGKIAATAKVDANLKKVDLNASSQKIVLQNLHKEFVVDGQKDFGILSGGEVDIELKVSTSGETYRQLAERLDGRSVIIVNESRVQTGKLNFFTNAFINQILAALKLGRVDANLDLKCAVVRTDFSNGKALFPEGIAVHSNQFNLVSDGKINLVNDKVDFSIHPFSGKVVDVNITQAVSSFIKVKGTLENPQIALDDKEAVKAIVGVVTTGPAYLGGAMVLDGAEAPCYNALKGTEFSNRFPAPTGVTAKTQDTYKDATKAINESVKALKQNSKQELNDLKENSKQLLDTLKGLRGKK